MTRLQKKCLIAVAGTHLLVVVAILCSGFIRPTPKPDNSTLLDVIPANLVDAALNSGVKNAQPPPPTPPQQQPPTPQPQVQQPTPPAQQPPKQETLITKIEKALTPDTTLVTKDPGDQPKPKPQKQRQIEVNLKPVVHTTTSTDTSAEDAKEAKEAKRRADERRKAFAAAVSAIKNNASSATKVELRGVSTTSSASYGAAIIAVYYHAWIPPQNMSADSAAVSFSVTIARDGSVISSHIVTSSGDADIDRAVQQMLDRVTFIAPFPDGAEDNQRTYPINFDATKTSIQ